MKSHTLILLSLLALTGCSTQQINQAICYGNGTCGANPNYRGPSAVGGVLPQSIITSSGTYIIGRNYSTGAINSVIQVSRGK